MYLLRSLSYVLYLTIIYVGWCIYMYTSSSWGLFLEFWQMPITMVFGSFVAGSTATGGAAVSFPVFTKVLSINPSDAKLFGLMIQSVGMTAASVFLWSRRTVILWRVVIPVVAGSGLGLVLSNYFVVVSGSVCKVLFTTMASVFMAALLYSSHFHKRVDFDVLFFTLSKRQFEFFIVGMMGGLIAEKTGTGVDMILFVLLTLVYRLDEKVSIPTTIVCMALSSVLGTVFYLLLNDITPEVINYWLVCVPVVAVGAPLGAYVLSNIHRMHLVYFMSALISLDFLTTIMLVEVPRVHVDMMVLFVLVSIVALGALIYRGNKFYESFQRENMEGA